MRFPRHTLATAALSLGVLSTAGFAAGPAFADSSTPNPAAMAGMDMAGMDHLAAPTPTATATPDLAAGIQRSRLKPLFLTARMDGRQEVQVAGKPPVGDPKGSATGVLRVQGNRITYAFSWKGISAPQLGHIHQGAKGVNGPVVVPLFTTAMPDTATAAAGVLTVDDPATADALRANPSGFYLNLHTKEFSGGAVRGQLSKLNHSADLLNILSAGTAKAFLSGDQEVPVKGGPAVGDPTGRAVAHISAKGTTVKYSFAWLGISPTLGHIHKAAFGANGPVVVPLFTTSIPATVTAVSGTVTGTDRALVTDIANNPQDYYANLHTTQFPGGAVRGQLFNRNHRKATTGGSTPTTGAPSTPELTATDAILDSGKNLSEPDGSAGLNGPGCQNVPSTIKVRSIQADGTYQIFSGPDCTGRSTTITGNALDLEPLGFDKQVASIRFK
jgi:CHRD domain-containing protein